MSNLATYMRITGLPVSNDDVDTRKAASADLASVWGKLRDGLQIVTKAAQVAEALSGDGVPPAALGTEVEAVVQKRASAFLQSERPLEVGICAASACLEMLAGPQGNTGWLTADVLAAGLWSALAFQPSLEDAKRELLRVDLLNAARLRSISSAESARTRTNVANFGNLALTQEEGGKIKDNFTAATTATIDALRRNAALDREELDFLWWSQRGRSRLLNRSLGALSEPLRLVATGIEAASVLRRLPCEVHRDLVLRLTVDNPELNLPSLLAAVGTDRETLGGPFREGVVASVPAVFPLLNALATGATSAVGANVNRPSEEWGARALLEAALARQLATGPSTL